MVRSNIITRSFIYFHEISKIIDSLLKKIKKY